MGSKGRLERAGLFDSMAAWYEGANHQHKEDTVVISSEAVAIAAATLIGPIAAVLITRWNDKRAQDRQRRMHVYRTLMATRRVNVSQDHVGAINLVEVEFHGVKPVIEAWTAYITHLSTPTPGGTAQAQILAWNDRRAELLSMLLVRIAANLRIAKGEIEILHGGYAPQHWATQEARIAQIQEYAVRLSEGRAVLPVSTQAPPSTNPFPPPPA
jgi:hypothetical protein